MNHIKGFKKYNEEVEADHLDIFQEEFGLSVISIIKSSKKLKDIRDGFIKHLNLTTLYEFALENKIA
jgi:hypothetical protein